MGSSWLWWLLRHCLFSMTLTVLNSADQALYIVCPYLGLVFFSCLNWYWDPNYLALASNLALGSALCTWQGSVCQVLPCRVTLSPLFPYCPLWKVVTMYESESLSITLDSLQPHGLCPWNSPGQNTGVGSLSLLQGIFPTQRLNPGLLHCRQILYQLSHQESPCFMYNPHLWSRGYASPPIG